MSRTTRRLYVCKLCSLAYCHPINYCYECPGKTEVRDVPFPNARGYFEGKDSMEKYVAWLHSHGLKEGRC